ncbi:MAG: hydrogenase maturation protease [Deltaproteobacteria bacterium]|nr:hydrogenase maturation protease [Deltaproteobacteria bacterium]
MTRPEPARIVCIGNRFVEADALGPRVFDRLSAQALPRGVAVIDGGTRGPDLLSECDGARRIVFVDALRGFGPPGEVVRLSEVDADLGPTDHGAGLPWLLRALPLAFDPAPDACVVGADGAPDDALCARVAAAALAAIRASGGAP